ncbi:hypothetical protein LOD99_9680 [Oopsacas minuta]|uniref:type I protein arginine methyltransferase n=1 Tax=Oopsacas minuta TaxID=111878 RepID=A0AAV7KM70_9METZ|nr:hypothetical protein LOD99_9680 [Oopsacas minuta]
MASAHEQDSVPLMKNKKLDDSDSDSDWSEVEHDGYGDEECLCLFCELAGDSANQILAHITQEHGIDLQEFIKTRGLRFHDVIRMINYIRENKIGAKDLVLTETPYEWEYDKYYPAFLKDDPLLTYDFGAP